MSAEIKEFKLQIRVPEEFYKEFKAFADRWGLTMSQLGNICVQSGYRSVVRALTPEDAFTPEKLADIIKALDEKGVRVELPERKKHEG